MCCQAMDGTSSLGTSSKGPSSFQMCRRGEHTLVHECQQFVALLVVPVAPLPAGADMALSGAASSGGIMDDVGSMDDVS